MMQSRPSSFKLLPPVIKNLLIINILFYAATWVINNRLQIDLTDLLGLHFPLSEKFHFYQLFTYLFMHDPNDIFHLVFNMFALWMFGYALENLWGGKRFLFFYLVTGIGAGLVHYTIVYFETKSTIDFVNAYIQHPTIEEFQHFVSNTFKPVSQDLVDHYNSMIPTKFTQALRSNNVQDALIISTDYMKTYKVDFLNMPLAIGASGAVFGILVGFGMLFPNTELIMLFFPIPIKAKYAVVLYAGIELFFGVAQFSWDNVAHFAHLGGALFGFIIIKYWQKKAKTFY